MYIFLTNVVCIFYLIFLLKNRFIHIQFVIYNKGNKGNEKFLRNNYLYLYYINTISTFKYYLYIANKSINS